MNIQVHPFSDCQDEQRFETSLEHKVAMVMHGMGSAIEAVLELSGNPEALTMIRKNMGTVRGAQLALCIVVERAKKGSDA